MLQCVEVCGSALQLGFEPKIGAYPRSIVSHLKVLQCVAVSCSVLQCVAVCRSVLHCGAVSCS